MNYPTIGIDFIGLPLRLVAKEGRHKDKRVIYAKMIIDEYAKENSSISDRVLDIILKLMELNLSLTEINEKDVSSYMEELKEINNKFKWVNKYLETLDAAEKKNLYLSYFDDLIIQVRRKLLKNFSTYVNNKEEWDLNDPLIVSYLSMFYELLIDIRSKLEESKASDIAIQVNLYSLIIAIYSSIVYGYVKNKLNPEVMRNRYSELAYSYSKYSMNQSNFSKKIIDQIKSIPIPESL